MCLGSHAERRHQRCLDIPPQTIHSSSNAVGSASAHAASERHLSVSGSEGTCGRVDTATTSSSVVSKVTEAVLVPPQFAPGPRQVEEPLPVELWTATGRRRPTHANYRHTEAAEPAAPAPQSMPSVEGRTPGSMAR